MTKQKQESRWSRWVLFALSGAGSLSALHCGFGNTTTEGTGGTGVTNPTGNPGPTVAQGGVGNSMAGSGSVAGSVATAGAGQVAGSGPVGGAAPTAGSGTGGTGVQVGTFKNYEVTGTWPTQPVYLKTAPGKLTYTKVEIHKRFLAESCAIADYNGDDIPDVSSGRRWYEGPFGAGAAIKEHIFRGGHDDLPNKGTDAAEIDTGVSDDWSDAPYDVDGDGAVDIINIANCDVAENKNPNPKPAPQPHATAYWYKNPGKAAVAAAESMWESHIMHADVRLEQHGLVDVDGDGYPEFFGACKDCAPGQTKGYYQGNKANPNAGWVYHPVTKLYTFPFGGTGWLHGQGFGDVNKDGISDLLERGGAWIKATGAAPNTKACTAGAPEADCGYYPGTFYDGNAAEERGSAHMYAFDVDGDGDNDIVSADGAHHWGLSWYEQTAPGAFTKRQFMGSDSAADKAKYGPVVFSEPHAMQVADMDGDGVPDLITGKMRFAHPIAYNDPDPMGDPVLYVFKTTRNTPSAANGGSVTFTPVQVDKVVGVGRQLSVGHINTDGIMDICIASKLGLYVFLGQ